MKKAKNKPSLVETHPDLIKEWNYEKNEDLNPEDVTSGSRKRVWWICSKGHEWNTYAYSRAGKSQSGCPECHKERFRESKKNARPKFEDSIAHLFPELVNEWNYEKNTSRGPEEYSHGSNIKVWWICSKGHEWETAVSQRKTNGCPYCAGQKISEDNSFGSKSPHLVKEWHPTKNTCSPFEVAPYTHKKAWFICSEGHEWHAFIANRSKGKGCPYCSGHKPTESTSLYGVNPELCKEWHPNKNGDKKPTQYKPQSNEKVWWLCSKGHEYQSLIYSRQTGRGCPICTGKSKTSFPEQAIMFYLKTLFPKVENRKKLPFLSANSEADIYIDSLNLAIEYDGYHHFKTPRRDETKNKMMDENGVKLIRIRQFTKKIKLPELERHNSEFIHHDYENKLGLDKCIIELIELINQLYDLKFPLPTIDIKKDRGEILKQLEESERNLETLFPELAEEWHPTKNGQLLPNQVTPFTHTTVWWKCKLNPDHEWESKISNRSNGRTCPYCLNRKINHTNSLKTLAPEIAKQWHPTKNGDLGPESVALNYNKKVWWRCSNGHEWESTPNNKVSKAGAKCLYCSGFYVTHETSFGYLYESLVLEWHPTKNEGISPYEIKPKSNKKVWWKCAKGHEWRAQVSGRSSGTGCPYCSGNKVSSDNNLAFLKPELLKEWDYERNKDVIAPQDVTIGSNKNVFWKCSHCKSSYKSSVRDRVHRKREKCKHC